MHEFLEKVQKESRRNFSAIPGGISEPILGGVSIGNLEKFMKETLEQFPGGIIRGFLEEKSGENCSTHSWRNL